MVDKEKEPLPPLSIVEQINQIYAKHKMSLFQHSREIVLAEERSLEELRLALTVVTELADLALRIGLRAGAVVPDTRASRLIGALKLELDAADRGVAPHALSPRHAGKTLPSKTSHPQLVSLRDHAVAGIELLVDLGYTPKAAKRSVTAVLEFVGLELWGSESLRKYRRKLCSAKLDALKSEILRAVAMGGREVTTIQQVKMRMGTRKISDLHDSIFGHIMNQANLAARVMSIARLAERPRT